MSRNVAVTMYTAYDDADEITRDSLKILKRFDVPASDKYKECQVVDGPTEQLLRNSEKSERPVPCMERTTVPPESHRPFAAKITICVVSQWSPSMR